MLVKIVNICENTQLQVILLYLKCLDLKILMINHFYSKDAKCLLVPASQMCGFNVVYCHSQHFNFWTFGPTRQFEDVVLSTKNL